MMSFIVKAKKHTYASGNPSKKIENGFEEFTYEEGDYLYRDRYCANNTRYFGGEEIVFFKGKTVWIMNYYGYILSDKIDKEKLYTFLRKAMSLVNEKRPFRGPSNFKEGNFEYVDKGEGNITQFKGNEKIFLNGNEIYNLYYHGGSL